MAQPVLEDLRADVLRKLLRLAPVLDRLTAEGLARRGLSHARARLLHVLADEGPQVMSALSNALDITPRAVTALVDRLESDNLVRRCDHPTDRRSTVVELTPTGRRTCRGMRAGHRRLAEELLGSFDRTGLTASGRVLDQVASGLDRRRAGRHTA